MTTEITKQFIKEATKLPNTVQIQVAAVIDDIRAALSVTDIRHIKHLYAKKNRIYYRIRVGDYRIGMQLINDVLHLQTVGRRGDFYKDYPPK
jgi:mRNA interferase RelE/StbE